MAPVDFSPPDVTTGKERWPLLDPRHSLRARFALLFGAAAVGLTAMVTWLGTTSYRDELAHRTGDLLATLAFEVGDKAERVVYERLASLQVIADSVPMPNGGVATGARTVLDPLFDSTPEFAWIGMANRDGTIVIGTQRGFEGTRASIHPWFIRGQTQAYVGEPRVLRDVAQLTNTAESTETHFIDLGAPMRNRDANAIGVIGAYLRTSWILNLQASVLSLPSRRDHLLGTVYNNKGEAFLDEAAAVAPTIPSNTLSGPPRGMFIESTADGAVFVTGYSRTHGYHGINGLNWIVTVRQPIEEVFAPIVALRRWMMLAGGLLAILFAIVGWYIASPVSRELRRIAASAQRIKGGDALALMPSPSGRGEIARACAALRDLIEHLRGR